jgi:hypothetical protein
MKILPEKITVPHKIRRKTIFFVFELGNSNPETNNIPNP